MPLLAGDLNSVPKGRVWQFVTPNLNPVTSPDGWFYLRLPVWVIAIRARPTTATPIGFYSWGSNVPTPTGVPPLTVGITISQASARDWLLRPIGQDPELAFTASGTTPHMFELLPWIPGELAPGNLPPVADPRDLLARC